VRPDALCVREELKSNTIATFKVGYGDVEEAFRRAPHVFSQTLSQHRGCAHPLEGRGLLAEVMPSDDSLIVWASTQKAHDLASTILSLVDIDERKLRVATPDVGGGFGPKLCVYPEDIAVVAAARLLRRSVKWIEDRREHFTNAAQERDQQWSMHIAVDGEGKILGVRGDLLHDQGAYALQDVNLPYNSASATTGPYIVPAFAMNVAVVMTNKGPVSSVRGAGYPQATFAIERLMDLVAGELGLDRALVRRRNLIPPDKMPYELPIKARSGSGIKYDSGDYHAALATVLEKSGSFQTATLSMSSGPITYVGSSVADFTGVASATFVCDHAGSEQIANRTISASLFILTSPPAAQPALPRSSRFLEACTKVPCS